MQLYPAIRYLLDPTSHILGLFCPRSVARFFGSDLVNSHIESLNCTTCKQVPKDKHIPPTLPAVHP